MSSGLIKQLKFFSACVCINCDDDDNDNEN